MTAIYATAPTPPGALGEDVEDRVLLRYLDEMMRWRDTRRAELDALDEAALEVTDPQERAALTPDVTLSMTLWQAVADRLALILATWDSGRVGEQERRRITTLVWGTLEQPGGRGAHALAVSLPEACRLSDSLAASLRTRLRLDGADPNMGGRVRDLRAQVERIADQVALIPEHRAASARRVHEELDASLTDIEQRMTRGADVGGLVAPLEARAATAERDLIVAASARDHARADRRRAEQEVAELAARGEALRALALRTRAEVTPAPTLGVPDVTALGEIPGDPEAIRAFIARLERVDRALTHAHGEYAAALERREDLVARARAVDRALADDETSAASLAALHEQTEQVLAARPTDLTRLEALIGAQESFARAMGVSL